LNYEEKKEENSNFFFSPLKIFLLQQAILFHKVWEFFCFVLNHSLSCKYALGKKKYHFLALSIQLLSEY